MHIAVHGVAKLLVDAKLADAGVAVAQAAMGQAVKRHIAFFLEVGCGLELGLDAQVFVEPGRAHRARGQARHAHELHYVLRLGLGQHLLEGGRGVAFLGHGKGGAQLHG